MRILGACIFSKFFGGKITAFSTDVTYRITIINLAHAYFERPCFFFFARFLAGNWGLERENLDKEK